MPVIIGAAPNMLFCVASCLVFRAYPLVRPPGRFVPSGRAAKCTAAAAGALTAPRARIAGPAAALQSPVAGGLPLAELVGAALEVPVVVGGTIRYVNLDYAASAPALRAVADRAAELLPLYSSVHRGAGYASAVCTSAYEAARGQIASFFAPVTATSL